MTALAQVKFEKGYIVDNDGRKIECLIENKDWAYNPESLHYKLSKTSQQLKATTATAKEFEVYNYPKFVRASVQIDTSYSRPINKLSAMREPEWMQDTLFLKVIVEGKASLYYYETSNLRKFFFSSPLNPLVRQR